MENLPQMVIGHQYAVGALEPVLRGDLKNCSLVTFSKEKAKMFISNQPLLYFLDRPYVSEVVGVYKVSLEVDNPDRLQDIQRVFFPDQINGKGILGSPEMKEESDGLFGYRFVEKSEGIHPLLTAVYFNPDLPDGKAIRNLVKKTFGEWEDFIDIKPYKKITGN